MNCINNLSGMKVFTIGTLATGIYLHLSRLVFGMAVFQQYLFTPVFEIFFSIPMLAATVFQLMSYKKIGYKNKVEKIVFNICLFQFVVSVPLHVGAFIKGSTDYVHLFPPVYSVVSILIWVFFIYIIGSLKIKQS